MIHRVFNIPIKIKDKDCNFNGKEGGFISPSVNLFVKVTDKCNANCLFCSNKSSVCANKFNIDKFRLCIDEIRNNFIKINKINITGGEPSTSIELTEKILTIIPDNIHVHLNTNGLLNESQYLMKNDRWDSISISLHHYDKEKLSELYHTKISDDALQFIDLPMYKINASCNLIKGYIDSYSEIEKMLNFAISKNIRRIGFVSLMKLNYFFKNNYI